MRAALALLLVAAPAAADPLDLREDALREGAVEVEPADVRVTWRADAVAASTGSGTRAARAGEHTASVGAEVAVSSDDCDFVLAGGQVDARTGDGAPLAFQQWASVCPLAGAIHVGLDHHLVWDVEPSLLAPPRLRREGNRRETIGFEMGVHKERPVDPMRLVPLPREYADLVTARMELGFGWVPDRPDALEVSVGARVGFVRWVREREDGGAPFDLRVIAVEMDAVMPAAAMRAPGERAVAMAWGMKLDVARVDGVRAGGFRLGAALGFGDAALSWSDGMEGGFLDVIAGRASASIERDVGRVTARVAAGRDLWPTWDGRAVIDDRVTASVAAELASVRGRVEVSAARVGLLALETGFDQTDVGGATVIAERDLGGHVTARARVDLGRSVYAAGATFDRPRWAAEGLVSLSVHAGTR